MAIDSTITLKDAADVPVLIRARKFDDDTYAFYHALDDRLPGGYNRGGSITAANTSQLVAAQNASRTKLIFQNTSDTIMYISEDGNPATIDSYRVAPGVTAEINTYYAVYVFCTVSGKTFAATEQDKFYTLVSEEDIITALDDVTLQAYLASQPFADTTALNAYTNASLALNDSVIIPGDGRYMVTSLSPLTWVRQSDSDAKLAGTAKAGAETALTSTLAAVNSQSDTLTSTSGRTLLKRDATTLGSASMAAAAASAGIDVTFSASGTQQPVCMSTPLVLTTGLRAQITMSFAAQSGTSHIVGIGFGASGSRNWIDFKSDGKITCTGESLTALDTFQNATAGSVFTTGQTCSLTITWDGAGRMRFSFATPAGSVSYTVPRIMPSGAVWLSAYGSGSSVTRFLNPLTILQQPTYQESLYLADRSAVLSAGSAISALSAALTTTRLGRQTAPITPTVFAYTYVNGTATTKPWRAGLDINLAASGIVILKRFNSSGVKIGNSILLGTLSSGRTTMTADDIFAATGEYWTGSAGEYLAFYSPQAGVTTNTVDGDGWWGIAGNVQSFTVASSKLSGRVEATVLMETNEVVTATAIRKAALDGAKALVMPDGPSTWCSVPFGRTRDGYWTHDYNPMDTMPIASPSAASFVYYVDPTNGSDSNAGTSSTAAYKSLYKALHNVTGSVWVWMMGDADYTTSGIGATIAASAIVILPYATPSATVTSRVYPSGTWTLVGGTTATYENTFAVSPQEIWDAATLQADATGANTIPTRFAASSASSELPAGSRKITGTGPYTVRVRTSDSRNVSLAPLNIKAMAVGDHFALLTTANCTIWMDRINLQGGVALNGLPTSNRCYFYASNAKWGLGSGGNSADYFHSYGTTGITSILYRIGGYEMPSDLFGYDAKARFVEIDCGWWGGLIGYADASASNVSTAHSGGQGVRCSTAAATYNYTHAQTRPIHDVINAITVNLGIVAGDSRIIGGGAQTDSYKNCAIVAGQQVSDGSKIYCADGSIANGSVSAFGVFTGSDAQVLVFNPDRNGVPDYTGTTVQGWWPF